MCRVLLLKWHRRNEMDTEAEMAWLEDSDVDERQRIAMCHAAALEDVGGRREGVDALRVCLGVGEERFAGPNPTTTAERMERAAGSDDEFQSEAHVEVFFGVALALAKLSFKDN